METHLALRSAAAASGAGLHTRGAGTREVPARNGPQPQDAVIYFVQRWLEARQDHATGAWYAGVESPHHNVVKGIFKLFVT